MCLVYQSIYSALFVNVSLAFERRSLLIDLPPFAYTLCGYETIYLNYIYIVMTQIVLGSNT